MGQSSSPASSGPAVPARKKKAMAIRVPKREAAEVQVQVSTRIPADLAKRLRVYAVQNDTLVSNIVEAGIRAVLGEKSAA